MIFRAGPGRERPEIEKLLIIYEEYTITRRMYFTLLWAPAVSCIAYVLPLVYIYIYIYIYIHGAWGVHILTQIGGYW